MIRTIGGILAALVGLAVFTALAVVLLVEWLRIRL